MVVEGGVLGGGGKGCQGVGEGRCVRWWWKGVS